MLNTDFSGPDEQDISKRIAQLKSSANPPRKYADPTAALAVMGAEGALYFA